MFGNKPIPYVILGFCIVMVVNYAGSRIKQNMENKDIQDEYDIVKKYLLNDSAMYGKNRPKLWIHSKYEINARMWKNFMSRNSTDLNQPYLYLTVQSIINHCGDYFHICLIDDDTFEKLIPTWSVKLNEVPEPMRSRYRDIGMLQLLYIYGGIRVPNSFLCTKNLKEVYKQGISHGYPFIAEKRNRTVKTNMFIPDMEFMGSKKEDPKIEEMIRVMNQSIGSHFQKESELTGKIETWCLEQIEQQQFERIDGKIIGIKSTTGKPILLEDLMSSDYLDYDSTLLHGILIPKQELLKRPKFQYYAILPVNDVLAADSILSKYFKTSMVDGVDEYYKKRSVNNTILAL
jgi:hypothetical protein